ncbi:MAG: DNA double-strand break repair nuclease NurA [Vulcanisaeta sp.]|nr:DNA double-strand break repair nuclease NurA [Vulcanisaeta sp.]MCG2895538.1 DNA double-strand break repair nuclease NurA [Vulcanisaeta sp.]
MTTDAGLGPSEPYNDEDDSLFITEPMGELQVLHVLGLGRRSPDVRVVVVDGSSRRLGSPRFRVFLAGVAVYGGNTPLWLYPMTKLFEGVKFIGVKAPKKVLGEIENDRELTHYVKVKFENSNTYFHERANEEDVSDDVRMSLESWAIEKLAGELGNGYAVVLDGPLYLGVKVKEKLAARRVNAIRGLEERGVPVVGVVKRVENSRKLCDKNVVNALSKSVNANLGVDLNHCNDPLMIQVVGKKMAKGVGDVLLIGPFKQRHNKSSNIMNYTFPERVFWYVYSGLGPKVFRIETLSSMYSNDEFRNIIDGLVTWLASSIDRSGIPYIVNIADHFAKQLTRSMYLLFYNIAKARDVAFNYDTEQEALGLMNEYTQAVMQVLRGVPR